MELYCNDLFNYGRRESVEVKIGNTPLGGKNPIRIQSMTNTNTLDVEASEKQCEKIAQAGAAYVRLTAQGVREAESLAEIRSLFRKNGFSTPLVADIHFNPKAAEVAAKNVEKVRINPGNFTAGDVDKIEEKLLPLLKICKENKTTLRIGVNHGSLSSRIMDIYGDTPQGMVASAMEFIRICNRNKFHNIVISMKASNTLIMVQSVRLLSKAMREENMNYPLHLGVTEAGNGEDGRIKSAVGIGALLADGIGDTIRVSLSEDPELEVPVAQKLLNHFTDRKQQNIVTAAVSDDFNPYVYSRRKTLAVGKVGGENVPVVVATTNDSFAIKPDYITLNDEALADCHLNITTFTELTDEKINFIKNDKKAVIILSSENKNAVGEMRAAFHKLLIAKCLAPVILHFKYKTDDEEMLQLAVGADLGALLLDGFGDGVFIENSSAIITANTINTIVFGALQAARLRITKTEYISCPSCGRTLFDLQSTIAKIKAKTSHLVGLKIGIMGCIVNGPGEMADADYGYVGAGKGRVSLYKKQTCIEKNIDADDAVEKLIELIKANGDWEEK